MKELQKRAEVTQATERRFRDKPFDWAKSATCIHMLRYHAAKLGHQLPVVPRFRSPLGAKKALKDMGFKTLPDLLDEYFERVPVAFLRVGDIMAFPGTDGFEAIYIKGGGRKCLGWHESAPGCTIVDVDVTQAIGGWRVNGA